ncbi:MAG TPA: glycosyltransferase family 39 protein [Pyrinomonadaceae bacterium]|nr:glycosyltransferase family 39 protein [Pyrinomonadaceae bacterium]
MQSSVLAKRLKLPLLIITLIIYFYGLGRLPLLGSDEPRYAEVAREMMAHHTMVTPTLGGHAWFEKPALMYWMMMAGFQLFGVTEWSARAGSALCGVLTVLLLYWMVRRVEKSDEEEEGLAVWCSVALAASAGSLAFSRAASSDIGLTMTVTAALACLFASQMETSARRQRLFLLGFHAAVGLSLLAKGLVGIVIPYGVAASYYTLRRERPSVEALLSLIWGVPLSLLVAGTWYAPVIARHGWTFIDQFFIQHHFSRFVSNKYHHPQRFYFYLPILLMLVVPWTIFLIVALTGARRWEFRAVSPLARLRVLALAWLLLPVLFFSISVSKLPAYILPVLPAAALLIGERLKHFMEGKERDWVMRATGAILLLLVVFGLGYNARSNIISWSCAVVAAAPMATAGLLAIVAPGLRKLCVVSTCAAIFLIPVLLLNCDMTKVASRDSVRDLLQMASAKGYGETPLYQLHEAERSSEFYAAGRLVYGQDGEPLRLEDVSYVERVASSGETILVLVPSKFSYQLYQSQKIAVQEIGDNGAFALFAVRAR